MLEIAFIAVAGLITIGLSINSIYKSNKQEIELKNSQNELEKAQKAIIDKEEVHTQDLKHKQEQLYSSQVKLSDNQTELYNLQNNYAKESEEKNNKIISLQEKLQEKSDFLAHETVRLQKPITNNFRISLQIWIYDEYYTSLIKDCNLKELKKGNAAAEFPNEYLLPADFHILGECDSVIKKITIEILNKIKEFGVGLTFHDNESKLMLELLGFDRLKNYTVKESEEKEKQNFSSSMYNYNYQLMYFKEFNCFCLDIHNLRMPIERRSESAVSLNDLNNSTLTISTINPDFLNQGTPINGSRKNFNKVEIRVGGLFCGEYIIGGLSGFQYIDGKYVIYNFKVSSF